MAIKGFSRSLTEGGYPTLPSTWTEQEDMPFGSDDEKRARRAMKRHDVAVAALLMTMTKEDDKALIADSKSNDWPNGNSYAIMKALCLQYAPKDLLSAADQVNDLKVVSITQSESPRTLFMQLATICKRYETPTYKIPMKEMLAVILTKIPKKYVPTITQTVNLKGAALILKDLKTAVCSQYCVEHLNEDKDD